MIWAVVSVVLGLAGTVWTWKRGRTQPRPQTPGRHRADATTTEAAPPPGDDDQFRRRRSVVPHIRRHANAENAAETTTTNELAEGERS